MKRKLVFIMVFLFAEHIAIAQCIIPCNSNIGIFSNDDPSTIAYDNIGSSYHTTFTKEKSGVRIWGEIAGADGTSHQSTPWYINSTNYPALTGKLYHVGIGSQSIGDMQLVALTSTGLFVSGTPNTVVSSSIKNSSAFQKISVALKADGLPPQIKPDSIKMMFVTFKSIVLTTCGGRVFTLSIDTNMRGANGNGSATTWNQVLQSNGVPLSNVAVARGCSRVGFALKNDSTLWTWGDDVLKGDGSSNFNSNIAIKMENPADVSGIKMIQATRNGYFGSGRNSISYYLLGTNKQVYALGKNNYGQLGDRTTIDKLVWVKCKYPNNSFINNALWISANEHDPSHSSLSVLNEHGRILTCGNNNAYMAGRVVEDNVNYLDIPNGINTSDTIVYSESGGHTTAIIKHNNPKYGYVGHHVNGSLGNNSTSDNIIMSFDFNTPPAVDICGTHCDTPKIIKQNMSCESQKASFIIKGKKDDKIFYKINDASLDSLIIGSGDTSIIYFDSPQTNIRIHIIKVFSKKIFCNLNLNLKDTIKFISKYSSINHVTLCRNDSIFWRGKWRSSTKIYSDSLLSQYGCDSIISLNLKIVDSLVNNLFDTICENSFKIFKNIPRNSKGLYKDTLISQYGCDSIINLNLFVSDTSLTRIYDTACSKFPYYFNGQYLTKSGVYLDTFINSNKCDSLIQLNLIVFNDSIQRRNISICQGDFYIFKNQKLYSTGTYSDTITHKWNCQSITILELVTHPLPSADAGLNKIRVNCIGDSVQLGSSQSTGLQYSWSPNMSIDNPNTAMPWCKAISSQLYKLTVINPLTGCQSTDSVYVSVKNSTLTASKYIQNLNCFNDSNGVINISASQGVQPYYYSVNKRDFQSSPSFKNLKATNVSNFYVKDSKGCIYTDTFSISQPPLLSIEILKTKDLRCNNDSSGLIEVNVFGGSPPYKYQWSNGSTNSNKIERLKGGNYTITFSDTNQCTYSKHIKILEPNKLILEKFKLLTNPCFNDSIAAISIQINGGIPPYKYLWSNNDTTDKIQKLLKGFYWVKIYDANNCSDSAIFNLSDPPELKIDTILSSKLDCYDQAKIDIQCSGGTPNYSYSLDSGKNYSSVNHLTVNKTGKYKVIAKDKNQCSVSKEINIESIEPIKIKVFPQDTHIKMNEILQLNFKVILGDSDDIQGIRWLPSEGLSCSDCSNPFVLSYISEIYSIEVRYSGNCLTKDQTKVWVKDEDYFIPNAFYPESSNSENNQLRIYANSLFKAKLAIYNKWGEKVFETNEAHRIGWNGTYNGKPAPTAVYIYYAEIIYLNGRKVFKAGDITLIR